MKCQIPFSGKNKISWKLSPLEAIRMTCQILFSEKNEKNILICRLQGYLSPSWVYMSEGTFLRGADGIFTVLFMKSTTVLEQISL